MSVDITLDDIQDKIEDGDWTNQNLFSVLQSLSINILSEGYYDKARALLIRLLEHREQFDATNNQIIDSILRCVGLFPYIEQTSSLGLKGNLAYEYHKPVSTWSDDIVFHRGQAEVYRALLEGKNVVLSAPTSFGKSLLIDSLIAAKDFDNVLIIVPTLALIDETRIRLTRNFGDKYKIITQPAQEKSIKNIFVLTQERALDRDDITELDFLVIDEFYKLAPSHEDDPTRVDMLNAALRKYSKLTKQYYMLGPNISSLPEGFPEEFKCEFIKKKDTTVTALTHHLEAGEDKLLALKSLVDRIEGPTIIYCQSPRSANDVADYISANSDKIKSQFIPHEELKEATDWFGENFHPNWRFVKCLRSGVALHHGSIPRSLAQVAIHSFNEAHVPILVCTSTLIEGVNTIARNVIVYDHKIGKNKNIDFFTFNNIIGRSGRMWRHFVGNVYLFKDPPKATDTYVDIPVFTQDEKVSDSLLIQLDNEDLKASSLSRVQQYKDQTDLDFDILKGNKFIDPRAQIALARDMRLDVSRLSNQLAWTTYPTWDQLQEVCRLIFEYFKPKTGSGVKSYKQLAFRIMNLDKLNNLRNYIEWQRAGFKGENFDENEQIEEALAFVRNWATYKFPRYLRAIEAIQRKVLLENGKIPGNYTVYLMKVENLHMTPGLASLDEYGLPLPLINKIQSQLSNFETFDELLDKVKGINLMSQNLGNYERTLIKRVRENL